MQESRATEVEQYITERLIRASTKIAFHDARVLHMSIFCYVCYIYYSFTLEMYVLLDVWSCSSFFTSVSKQLICRDLNLFQIESQKNFESNLEPNRDLMNRLFIVQIESVSVLKSRFKSRSRDWDLPITAAVLCIGCRFHN